MSEADLLVYCEPFAGPGLSTVVCPKGTARGTRRFRSDPIYGINATFKNVLKFEFSAFSPAS